MCTINKVNDLSTAQSDISSLQESVNTNTTNISALQSYTVLNGTNLVLVKMYFKISPQDMKILLLKMMPVWEPTDLQLEVEM